MSIIVTDDNHNIESTLNYSRSNHMDQFLKVIGNISSFQTIQQIQQFMGQLVIDLHVHQDINVIHHILFTMLSSTKHLFTIKSLQRMVNTSQFIASSSSNINRNLDTPEQVAINGNIFCPSPSPIITAMDTQIIQSKVPPMTPLLLSNRSSSLPLQLSLSNKTNTTNTTSNNDKNILYKLIKHEPVTHILELPDHILSYCCSYLATKDLLLSADLCCNRLCQIARMPSSFHGKFIFGSAIHCEYHKLANNNDNDQDSDLVIVDDDDNVYLNKMLERFHHSKEIHFINIFNYDTIQMLKTCNFPKIESIYLYDRFNHLIEYLPSLIPNVKKLYITTNGGNETLDIIQANTNYYSDQLCTLFNGYSKSMESIELKHNTFYDIPLMLPEDAAKLILNKMGNLTNLELKNVYFPPDIDEHEDDNEESDSYDGYDTDSSGSFVERKYNHNEDEEHHHSVQHLSLKPYNEYCADHFDSSLRSLSLYWNVVGQNDIYDMVKLYNLNKLHLLIKLDNDSLDYNALTQFIVQSECLLNIKDLEIDIDLNDAVWSSFEKILEISRTIFSILVNNDQSDNYKMGYIKINILDICNSTSYSHMFRTILPQIINNIFNNINNSNSWNILINVEHPIPDSDNEYYKLCMNNAIYDIKTNCSFIINNKINYIHSNHTMFKFMVSNELMLELKAKPFTNSIFL